MSYSFTKRIEKSKKRYKFAQRLKRVLKDFYIVMRHFKKLLLFTLEKFRMKNSILLHEIIDQTLPLFLLRFISTLK